MKLAWRSIAAVSIALAAPPAVIAHAPVRTPINANILFLPSKERAIHFANMERFYLGHVVHAGRHVRPLPFGRPLPLDRRTIDAFMAAEHVRGLVVLQDGRIRLERYSGGGPRGRWTFFSVTKSVTSTLIGAAIRDGFIRSVDDPVTLYLPQLAGSAYDGVTIGQLLTMRSGAAWNEDYTDPRSDVVQLYLYSPPAGQDRTIAYMRRLKRAAAPGTRWNYDTGETDLAGALLAAATKRSLADDLSQVLWQRFGMANNGYWLVDAGGHEAGGSGLSMTLRDAARFGELALEGGPDIVPAGWFTGATHPAVSIDTNGDGYGFFWWTFPDHSFAAEGIFGQCIFIDPAHRLVIAIAANWPHATNPALSARRARFEAQVIAAASRRSGQRALSRTAW